MPNGNDKPAIGINWPPPEWIAEAPPAPEVVPFTDETSVIDDTVWPPPEWDEPEGTAEQAPTFSPFEMTPEEVARAESEASPLELEAAAEHLQGEAERQGAEHAYQLGEEKFRSGDYLGAADDYLTSATLLPPGDAKYANMFNAAQAYANAGETERAAELMREYIANTGDPKAEKRLAVIEGTDTEPLEESRAQLGGEEVVAPYAHPTGLSPEEEAEIEAGLTPFERDALKESRGSYEEAQKAQAAEAGAAPLEGLSDEELLRLRGQKQSAVDELKAEKTLAAIRERREAMEEEMARRRQWQEEIEARFNELAQRSSNIKPNLPTGQRIAGVIAAGISGFLNPRGPNAPVQAMERAIERDIAQQKSSIGQEMNVLDRLMRMGLERNEAEEAMRQSAYDMAIAETEAWATKMDPRGRGRLHAELMVRDLRAKKEESLARAKQQEFENKIVIEKMKAAERRSRRSAALQRRGLGLQERRLGLDERAQRFREGIALTDALRGDPKAQAEMQKAQQEAESRQVRDPESNKVVGSLRSATSGQVATDQQKIVDAAGTMRLLAELEDLTAEYGSRKGPIPTTEIERLNRRSEMLVSQVVKQFEGSRPAAQDVERYRKFLALGPKKFLSLSLSDRIELARDATDMWSKMAKRDISNLLAGDRARERAEALVDSWALKEREQRAARREFSSSFEEGFDAIIDDKSASPERRAQALYAKYNQETEALEGLEEPGFFRMGGKLLQDSALKEIDERYKEELKRLPREVRKVAPSSVFSPPPRVDPAPVVKPLVE